ncbi:OmcA/MtrC family decaheme c-type cytochrome [Ferrimonas sp. SCSIO 43195]|uniref:OmcA/MtrC family decaheme c-type cytochrome n=1 Tax=Ferrimonas sp. SCSIO 43195 TaxID=2822844 RepID=UPI002075746A|nr:OmcA/MtrC family decaheme c-type cytochrome [Ferrimonas sp. SCSIO 43195]
MMIQSAATRSALLLGASLLIFGCDGDDGADGAPGPEGPPGPPGDPGLPAGSFTRTAESAAEVELMLQPGDVVVTGSDPFSIEFSASGLNGGNRVPLVGLSRIALYVMNQSTNSGDSGAPTQWQSHTQANGAGSSMTCTLTGKTTDRGGNEIDACTLVEDEATPGRYHGSWSHDGNAPVVLADGDPNLLHRVIIRAYDLNDSNGEGVADKVLSTPLDFIPASDALAVSVKDSVTNGACIQCHGALPGYPDDDPRIAYLDTHSNYQKVEQCVACHTPALGDADFPAMIHDLHAGIRDGFDAVGFPGELFQCKHCHGEQDSWQANLYGQACQSCHTSEDAANHIAAVGSDRSCDSCHGPDAPPAGPGLPGTVEYSHQPMRRALMLANEGLGFEFTSAVVSDNGLADDLSTLTVTANVTFNGAPAADDFDFTPYMTNTGRGILLGNVDTDGVVTRNATLTINAPDRVSLSGGVLTVAKDLADSSLSGSIYLTAEVQFCGEQGAAMPCEADGTGYANHAPVAYFNLDGGSPTTARHSQPDRVSVTETACNACHENLTHVKGSHGVTEFTQCMHCHNSTWAGSFHPTVNVINDDGSATEVEGIRFSNRDLVTVVHRYHSGAWDNDQAQGVYLNAEAELQGYPNGIVQCGACHSADQPLFAADGGLMSGKRAIAIGTDQYVSPVAASCRSCHAHADAAAMAHFESNGATVDSNPDSSANLPVESCSTCHGEGKTFGIDKVHGSD